jgi:DNA polymerase/3'-5' exonuclease PolX
MTATLLTPDATGRYNRHDAAQVADEIIAMIDDTCERITVAGSIRREKAAVKDVEIVVMPHDAARYRARLDALVHKGVVDLAQYGQPGKYTRRWGPDYRGISYRGIKIELFSATTDTWGAQLWLRTGPGDANTYCMAYLQGPAQIQWRDGKVYDRLTHEQIRVPDERAMFALWRMPYLAPPARSEAAYRRTARLPMAPRVYVESAPAPTQTSLF